MKDIKRKGSRSNRIVDESADLASKMKQGLVRSKDQFQNLSDDGQVTPEEYAQDKIKYWSEDAVHDAAHGSKETAKKTYDGGKKLVEQIKQKRRDGDSIKQTAKSTGKQSFKTMKKDIKTAGKSTHKGVKTAESSARTTIKTTEKAAKTAEKTLKASQKAAKASAKAAKRSAQAAKKAAEAGAKTAKAAAKATVAAIKSAIAAMKELVTVIAAGGSVALIVIIVITMVALIVGSCFGIFYSFGDPGEGISMNDAIGQIDSDYYEKIESIRSNTEYDLLEMRGVRARWREVLAVYSVKTTTDKDNAREVATMNDEKLSLLKGIFWDMHRITDSTETREVKEYTETMDENGKITSTEEIVSKCVLCIEVSHYSIEEMKRIYSLTGQQSKMLDELLFGKSSKYWNNVLYRTGGENLVCVAKTQIGNTGGQPYWSWYGFDSRVEWCACFVSWCANMCGYIEEGVIPKFSGCQNAVEWFTERGQWEDGSYTPKPGDIVFFDWDNKGSSGPRDGSADHVGIVEKIIDGKIYTVEGNSGDRCAERTYTVGHYELLGFGIPLY